MVSVNAGSHAHFEQVASYVSPRDLGGEPLALRMDGLPKDFASGDPT